MLLDLQQSIRRTMHHADDALLAPCGLATDLCNGSILAIMSQDIHMGIMENLWNPTNLQQPQILIGLLVRHLHLFGHLLLPLCSQQA